MGRMHLAGQAGGSAELSAETLFTPGSQGHGAQLFPRFSCRTQGWLSGSQVNVLPRVSTQCCQTGGPPGRGVPGGPGRLSKADRSSLRLQPARPGRHLRSGHGAGAHQGGARGSRPRTKASDSWPCGQMQRVRAQARAAVGAAVESAGPPLGSMLLPCFGGCSVLPLPPGGRLGPGWAGVTEVEAPSCRTPLPGMPAWIMPSQVDPAPDDPCAQLPRGGSSPSSRSPRPAPAPAHPAAAASTTRAAPPSVREPLRLRTRKAGSARRRHGDRRPRARGWQSRPPSPASWALRPREPRVGACPRPPPRPGAPGPAAFRLPGEARTASPAGAGGPAGGALGGGSSSWGRG